jgi:nucleoside-diphosphate-sugar epimerase
VSNFIVQALSGEPLTIYGDGSQTRSFCYVDDEIEGIYRLFMGGDASRRTSQPGGVHGAPARRAGARAHRLGVADRRAPAAARRPEAAQAGHHAARERLGWEPRVPLREGLERTIAYFAPLVRGG